VYPGGKHERHEKGHVDLISVQRVCATPVNDLTNNTQWVIMRRRSFAAGSGRTWHTFKQTFRPWCNAWLWWSVVIPSRIATETYTQHCPAQPRADRYWSTFYLNEILRLKMRSVTWNLFPVKILPIFTCVEKLLAYLHEQCCSNRNKITALTWRTFLWPFAERGRVTCRPRWVRDFPAYFRTCGSMSRGSPSWRPWRWKAWTCKARGESKWTDGTN